MVVGEGRGGFALGRTWVVGGRGRGLSFRKNMGGVEGEGALLYQLNQQCTVDST